MMIAPILQIFWSHRVSFLIVMCLTFIALAFVIFTLPTRATVRSSIEIGSAAVGGQQEAFEPPENVARRIQSVYGPATLLAMANKGVSPSILGALQNPNVESIGRSVVMVSTIDPSLEKEAKEFQEIIADLVTKELAPRARTLRESIANRLALASKVADDIEQQIKDDGNEIDRIGALTEDLRSQIEKQRANLAALYQRIPTAQAGDSAMLEAEIREQREQISSQTNLMGNLILERSNVARDLATMRRLRDRQAEAVADAQFEKNGFKETHISQPPALMPATESVRRRRFSLLVVAFAVSLLVGFGTIVMSHNMGARKI
jgi:hypothetical protein